MTGMSTSMLACDYRKVQPPLLLVCSTNKITLELSLERSNTVRILSSFKFSYLYERTLAIRHRRQAELCRASNLTNGV